MNTESYKILSQTAFVAGSLSIAGSLALWAGGRLSRNPRLEHDGLFVGLWVPSFFILADRLATAALSHQERQRSVVAGHEKTYEDLEAEAQCGPVQSPRPMRHVNAL